MEIQILLETHQMNYLTNFLLCFIIFNFVIYFLHKNSYLYVYNHFNLVADLGHLLNILQLSSCFLQVLLYFLTFYYIYYNYNINKNYNYY